jgi:hypothetical protein
MGQWTEFDVITGNPAILDLLDDMYINSKKTKKEIEKDFNKKYSWNNIVVAIKKDGSFSKSGIYDEYGNINILTPKSKKISETIVITEQGIDDNEGIMINKTTAEYMKNHKLFKPCIKKINLYEAIKNIMKDDISVRKDIKIGPLEKYIGLQYVNVTNQKKFKDDYGVLTEGIDAWTLVDPKLKTKDGKKNHERITKIIDTLMKKICSKMNIKPTKPTPSPKKSSCTKRNPSPPCKKGYESRKNKKGDSCCYKTKVTKPSTSNKTSPKTKRGCDLIIAQNVLNKFAEGKLYYYRSEKKVRSTKEALKIAISMIDNKC